MRLGEDKSRRHTPHGDDMPKYGPSTSKALKQGRPKQPAPDGAHVAGFYPRSSRPPNWRERQALANLERRRKELGLKD